MMLDIEYAMALAKVICDDMPDKVRALRFDGVRRLMGIANGYAREGMIEKPIVEMWNHKIPFVMGATSKVVMEEILKPSKPRYNGGGFVPGSPYHSEAEELMLWSLTSLWGGGPLISDGQKRYEELFKKYFPVEAADVWSAVS